MACWTMNHQSAYWIFYDKDKRTSKFYEKRYRRYWTLITYSNFTPLFSANNQEDYKNNLRSDQWAAQFKRVNYVILQEFIKQANIIREIFIP